MELRGTTIIAVRKDGRTAIAGDGQVTMSESVIMKATPHGPTGLAVEVPPGCLSMARSDGLSRNLGDP